MDLWLDVMVGQTRLEHKESPLSQVRVLQVARPLFLTLADDMMLIAADLHSSRIMMVLMPVLDHKSSYLPYDQVLAHGADGA